MEKRFIKKLAKYNHIIIFGAGLVGELTAKRLQANQLSEKIVGFAVSDKNQDSIADDRKNGLHVYEIDELAEYAERSLVLIATMPVLHDEIYEILEKSKFRNIIPVTAKLYESFDRNYIQDFRKKNVHVSFRNSENTVLFMASDNNHISGAFLCMVELCEMLSENGFAALVVLPAYGTGEKLLRQKQIPYTYVSSKGWGYEIAKNNDFREKIKFLAGQLSNGRAKKELVTLMKKQSVSLVHCNTTYTYVGAAAARTCKIPYVWHLRENMENQGYRFFCRNRAWKLIKQSAKVIAVSNYIENLTGLKDGQLTTVIYDAVEQENRFLPDREILKKKTVQMLIVGAVTPFKGQEDLINACGILVKRNIVNFYLRIVGAGERHYVEKLKEKVCRAHLESHILFYGTSNDMYRLYGQSDIAFTCGAKEAYGRVTIEALLSGCLVIGINSGATAELIRNGETGLLYEPGNIDSLAGCMEKAIGSPEYSRTIAKRGQIFAEETFTRENSLRQVLNVYHTVLEKHVGATEKEAT